MYAVYNTVYTFYFSRFFRTTSTAYRYSRKTGRSTRPRAHLSIIAVCPLARVIMFIIVWLTLTPGLSLSLFLSLYMYVHICYLLYIICVCMYVCKYSAGPHSAGAHTRYTFYFSRLKIYFLKQRVAQDRGPPSPCQ